MASYRFSGRTYTFGSPDPTLDSNTGAVLERMVAADLPQTIANHKQLQELKAAQAKQHRDEQRSIAQLINQEEGYDQ